MKGTRHSYDQIIAILKKTEHDYHDENRGSSVNELRLENRVSFNGDQRVAHLAQVIFRGVPAKGSSEFVTRQF